MQWQQLDSQGNIIPKTASATAMNQTLETGADRVQLTKELVQYLQDAVTNASAPISVRRRPGSPVMNVLWWSSIARTFQYWTTSQDNMGMEDIENRKQTSLEY